MAHLFMKYAEPRLEWIGEEDHALFKDAVTEWYVYQDELLGRVLARIDPDTTAVFIVSDHGFKSGERRIRSEQAVHIETAHLDHEPDGVFIAAGPGIRAGAQIAGASVLDVTPTLLDYLGLPVGKDMDGRVLTGLFAAERPIEYVASYDAEAGGKAAVASEEYGSEALADNVAALEALGYVRGSASSEAAADGGESSPEIHNNLAQIHLRTGELDAGVAEFEKALALSPRDAGALLGLSSVAAAQGNRARAEHLAKVAVASNPDSPLALAQLADLRRDAGDLSECVRLYGEALALHDAMPHFYLGLGDCLQRAGRYEEARASFTRALELEPDSIAAVYNLGVTAFQQGREDEAIERFEAVVALDASHPLAAAALNNLGTVHHDRGESEQAAARWAEAVAASPALLEARFNLAVLYLDAGRVDEAVPLLEQAAALAPDHELVHVRLARAYLEQGRGEDAYRVLTLVRRLHPDNWFAPLGLAVLFAATERPDEARPLLEEAFRLGGDAARTTAAGYPALAPVLAGGAPPSP
jgi:tetratricopeptide (TPR) repeat protein